MKTTIAAACLALLPSLSIGGEVASCISNGSSGIQIYCWDKGHAGKGQLTSLDQMYAAGWRMIAVIPITPYQNFDLPFEKNAILNYRFFLERLQAPKP